MTQTSKPKNAIVGIVIYAALHSIETDESSLCPEETDLSDSKSPHRLVKTCETGFIHRYNYLNFKVMS